MLTGMVGRVQLARSAVAVLEMEWEEELSLSFVDHVTREGGLHEMEVRRCMSEREKEGARV